MEQTPMYWAFLLLPSIRNQAYNLAVKGFNPIRVHFSIVYILNT